MKFTGEFTVPAPRAQVFERFNDPAFFAACLDGMSELDEITSDHYKAVLETRIAYIKFRFDVAVTLVERVAPEKVVARVEGSPKGVIGRLTATAVAHMEEAEGGAQTRISYEMDVALAGKLGSIGQPVLKSKAKEMERGFVSKANAAFAGEIA